MSGIKQKIAIDSEFEYQVLFSCNEIGNTVKNTYVKK